MTVKGKGLPYPKFVYTLPIPREKPIFGSLWVMRGSNCAVVHRTAGLLQFRARAGEFSPRLLVCISSEALSQAAVEGRPSKELERQAYGPSFVYDEFVASKSKFSALISSVSLVVSFLFLLFKPVSIL